MIKPHTVLPVLILAWITGTSLSTPFSSNPKNGAADAMLKIEVTHIKNLNGSSIHIGVFDKKGFPKNNQALYSQSFTPSKSKGSTYIKIPKGTYAVALYQDVNKNNKFDKSIIGLPKEPYGLSKNFRPTLSEPKFEDCSFEITEKTHNISIELIH